MKIKRMLLHCLKCFLGLFLLSCVLTHYFENFELVLAKRIRNLIYFGTLNYINIDPSSGIAMKNYATEQNSQISPVDVVQYVFDDVHTVLQNRIGSVAGVNGKVDADKDQIIHTADFLLNFAEKQIINGMTLYLYPYKFDYNDLKAPWYSCMAQAHVAELMLAAYELSDDKKYYDGAEYSLNYIKIPVSEGGGSIRVDGGLWYEEYVYPLASQCEHVLNGHLFVLDALYWMTHYDKTWQYFYNSGADAVISNLYRYDSSVWSWYDCNGVLAHGGYHQLHIDQLKCLNSLYSNKIFEKYIFKFTLYKYIPFGVFQRLIIMHNRMLFFLIAMNMFFLTILFISLKGCCLYFLRYNKQR